MEVIEKAFKKMGTRVKFGTISIRSSRNNLFAGLREPSAMPRIRVNIERDKKGEFFQIDMRGSVDLQILNSSKNSQHLLLFAKDRENAKYRYLCGHDERGWFAAAVPDAVSSVTAAMDVLKPAPVGEKQIGLAATQRNKRKNKAFLRQGEWFFIPAPDINPDSMLILRNEPIRRGRGTAHIVEKVFRTGGESVYVCRKYPAGLDEEKYKKVLKEKPRAKSWGWNRMKRNMTVYGRGRVKHRDHKTVTLNSWHRILPNRESDAPFIETLAFLD